MEFNLKNVRHNIGDKVVALMNHGGIIAGKEYKVLDVEYCSKCGMQAIHVGIYSTEPYAGSVCECGYKIHYNPEKRDEFKFSYRFAPLQEIDNLMASAIEEENYELAQTLKEIKP
jgi:hypothetical protein